MMNEPLAILGIGTCLPPARSVREVARANGGDDSGYRSWDLACQGGPNDHPSTMGTQALTDALKQAQVEPAELSLLLFTGASRDYVPSWSVSNEIMKLIGASDQCLGLDMTSGCLATLAALEMARTWLGGRGGGYAAIVASERWSQSIDYTDVKSAPLWSYGDSGGALVVSFGRPKPALTNYMGAEFRSAAANNGQVLIPYGGTREPIAPPGANPLARRLAPKPGKEITKGYRQGYGDAYAALMQRFDQKPARMICNQMSPQVVGMLSEIFSLQEHTIVTGTSYGHLGGVDVILGLQQALQASTSEFPILIGASTAYGFGTGLLTSAA
jgi:3-oxoacyl-[acyl-carrier-protein] synthase-3